MTVEIGEVTAIPPREQPVVIATGPLTTEDLTEDIKTCRGGPPVFLRCGGPQVTLESLDKDVIFGLPAMGREEEAYINCP